MLISRPLLQVVDSVPCQRSAPALQRLPLHRAGQQGEYRQGHPQCPVAHLGMASLPWTGDCRRPPCVSGCWEEPRRSGPALSCPQLCTKHPGQFPGSHPPSQSVLHLFLSGPRCQAPTSYLRELSFNEGSINI